MFRISALSPEISNSRYVFTHQLRGFSATRGLRGRGGGGSGGGSEAAGTTEALQKDFATLELQLRATLLKWVKVI